MFVTINGRVVGETPDCDRHEGVIMWMYMKLFYL